MAKHPLESKYGLSSAELLDAINARFRLKVALEGAVAEFQMAKHIDRLVGSAVATPVLAGTELLRVFA